VPRKKKEPTRNKSIRAPTRIWEKVKEAAKEEKVSDNAFIVRATEEKLNNRK